MKSHRCVSVMRVMKEIRIKPVDLLLVVSEHIGTSIRKIVSVMKAWKEIRGKAAVYVGLMPAGIGMNQYAGAGMIIMVIRSQDAVPHSWRIILQIPNGPKLLFKYTLIGCILFLWENMNEYP